MKLKLLFLLLFAVACTHDDNTADVAVSAQISGLTIDDVISVHVTVTGPGMANIDADLVRVGTTYRGTLGGIPVGDNRVFTADAFDASNTVIYHAESAPVTITQGGTALVNLQLTSTEPPEPFENHAPIIDALFLSAQTVAPGESIDLRVTAHDPDGDSLLGVWSATDGSFASPSGGFNVWFAPAAEGHYELTFHISDPDGAFDQVTVGVDVAASAGRGSATLTATINTAPRIVTIHASRLIPGVAAAADVVSSDADGDARTHAWSTDCGAVVSAADTTATLTVPVGTTATECTIQVDVTDARGATNAGTVVVPVGPEAPTNFDPIIDTTFQSVDTVDHDGTVVFRVTAHDVEGAPLSFGWNTDKGELSPQTQIGNSSEITWTAPGCFTGVATITLDVVDGDTGRMTTRAFTVSALSGDCTIANRIASWSGDNTRDDDIGGRTFVGPTAFGLAHRNAGFVYNGADSMTAPSTGLPLGNADRTLELWFFIDAMPTPQAFLGGYGQLGALGGAYLLGVTAGELFFSQWGDAISGGSVAPGSGFHHAAVTNQGSLASLYLDGVLVAQRTISINTFAGDFRIGHLDSIRGLDGTVDEIRVYDRALTAGEISRIFRGVAP